MAAMAVTPLRWYLKSNRALIHTYACLKRALIHTHTRLKALAAMVVTPLRWYWENYIEEKKNRERKREYRVVK